MAYFAISKVRPLEDGIYNQAKHYRNIEEFESLAEEFDAAGQVDLARKAQATLKALDALWLAVLDQKQAEVIAAVEIDKQKWLGD